MSPTDSEATVSGQQPGLGLRQAREAAGISLADLAKQTLIAPHRLKALERDDYEAAGGATYVKGYARAYARALNLDPAETVRLFERQLVPAAPPEVEVPAGGPGYDHGNRYLAGFFTIVQQNKRGVIGAGLVLIITTILLVLGSDDEQPGGRGTAPATTPGNTPIESPVSPPVESQPDFLPSEPTSPKTDPPPFVPEDSMDPDGTERGGARVAEAEPPSETADEGLTDQSTDASGALTSLASPPAATSTAVVTGTKTLEFHFTDACWLEVVDANGERIIAREAQSGDNLRLSGSAPFNIVLGNAPAASIAIDGEPVNIKPRSSTNVLRLNLGGDS